MSDLINRRDVIKAVANREMVTTRGTEYLNGYVKCQHDILDIIERLPSTQPEIIRCKDCKYRSKSGLCNMWSVFGTVTTDDDMYCSYGERGDSDDE